LQCCGVFGGQSVIPAKAAIQNRRIQNPLVRRAADDAD
jgi:hypothetical protein